MTEVRADHDSLRVLGARWFENFEPSHVVTFLNQVLSERGLAFGVRLRDEGHELTVYDSAPGEGPR